MSGYQDHKICPHCGRNDLDPLAACTCPGANKPRAMTDHSQRIRDITSRAEKATPEPWRTDINLDKSRICKIIVPSGTEFEQFDHHSPENAAFIAHARADVPWLLSQLDASLARERALREALKACIGLIEDAITRKRPDADDVQLVPDGSYMLSDARAALQRKD